jgi:hypothetical protein
MRARESAKSAQRGTAATKRNLNRRDAEAQRGVIATTRLSSSKSDENLLIQIRIMPGKLSILICVNQSASDFDELSRVVATPFSYSLRLCASAVKNLARKTRNARLPRRLVSSDISGWLLGRGIARIAKSPA